MANPFIATFDSECGNCAGYMSEGDDKVYAHNGIFVCEECAELLKIICPDCDGYKNPDHDLCYKCAMSAPEWIP